jgi:hypothetical protein
MLGSMIANQNPKGLALLRFAFNVLRHIKCKTP